MTTSEIELLAGTEGLSALLDGYVHPLPFTLVETNSESDSFGNTTLREYIIKHDDGQYFRLVSPVDSLNDVSGRTLYRVEEVEPVELKLISYQRKR